MSGTAWPLRAWNDGRLPSLDPENVPIVLKKDAVPHATIQAELLKEKAVREYQAGHSGFSFRVAKGVRYRTGQTRGRMVTVGTELVAQDQGVLTITSLRAVFSGRSKSLEFPYKRLVSIQVFGDGIQLAVSNRQTNSTLRLAGTTGTVAAALINAGAQEAL